jgi:hypothetical protein
MELLKKKKKKLVLVNLTSHFLKSLDIKIPKCFFPLTKYSILLMKLTFELFTLKIYFS